MNLIVITETQPTLEQLNTAAVRPSNSSVHREVSFYLDPHREAPLPSSKSGPGSLMSLGGYFRYLFHDGDRLIEVEYINGSGVYRYVFLDGDQISRVYTQHEAYAR